MANKGLSKVGVWAFILGIVIAIFASFIGPWSTPILVVVGIIVGLLNVTDKETGAFLMAAIAIMIAAYTAGASIAGGLATLGKVGEYLVNLVASINVLVFPATIVVALKSLYALSKD
jgi:uncharacterized paraquat-inducible protein A